MESPCLQNESLCSPVFSDWHISWDVLDTSTPVQMENTNSRMCISQGNTFEIFCRRREAMWGSIFPADGDTSLDAESAGYAEVKSVLSSSPGSALYLALAFFMVQILSSVSSSCGQRRGRYVQVLSFKFHLSAIETCSCSFFHRQSLSERLSSHLPSPARDRSRS
jgi:hypothetical protein